VSSILTISTHKARDVVQGLKHKQTAKVSPVLN